MNSPDGWTHDGHVDDELLAAIALEDVPTLDDDLGAGDLHGHVNTCAQCSAEVRALRETLALVLAGGPVAMVPPPAGVWEAVAAQIESERSPANVRVLSPAPASIDPIEPTGRSGRPGRPGRRVPVWWAAVAASVTLAAGVGVGSLLASEPEAPPVPAAQVLGNAALATVDAAALPRGAAEVRRHDDRILLHVQALDLDGPDDDDDDGTREVWLINTDGQRMVSLGLLASGESGDFAVTERLLDDGYRIVDISYEPNDGDPVHSGQSLARGTIEG